MRYIRNWKGIERIRDTPEEKLRYHLDLKDPLEYFLPGNLRRLWDTKYGKGPAHFIDAGGRVIHQEKPKKVEKDVLGGEIKIHDGDSSTVFSKEG